MDCVNILDGLLTGIYFRWDGCLHFFSIGSYQQI